MHTLTEDARNEILANPVEKSNLCDINHSRFGSREVFVGSVGASYWSFLQNAVFFAGKECHSESRCADKIHQGNMQCLLRSFPMAVFQQRAQCGTTEVTILFKVYLSTITCAQKCSDSQGSHFQHLL
jgi:hypothetical protein